jgi:LPXTG-site transpeptidase (sortase) family protein
VWRKLGRFFFFLSLICFTLSGILIWQRYYNPNRLSFSQIPPARTSKFELFPDRIIISEIGIDLPVIPSQIKDGVWQTTPRGISYLISSANPGEIGNSIFYGHKWPNLLGNLKNIKPGNKIMVLSKNQTRTFWISQVLIVSPKDIQVLNSGSNAQLTLYTCYGFADLKRLVVVAYTQTPK